MPPAPLDARLVPAALVAWAAVHVAVAQPAGWSVAAAAVVLSLAVVPVHLLLRERRAVRRAGTRPGGAARRRHRDVAHRSPAAAALLTVMVVAAVLSSTAAQVHARTEGVLGDLVAHGASAMVTGRVAAEPRAMASREWDTTERYRVVVDAAEVTGRGARSAARAPVVVLGPASWGELTLGDQVEVRGSLVATDPGDEAVGLLLTSRDPRVVGPPPWHLRAVNLLRGALRAVTADLSPQARGLVPGIAVGDDRDLPEDLRTDMRAVSLTHLTAVSGAHVAILLGAVLGAAVWLPRRARTAVGAVALVAFVALVRPEPSVLRSAVMGAVVLLALVLGRPARALPALCAAVVALLLVDPWLARSYGFALSVLATAGLVLLARPWARWLSGVLPRWLATAIAVPAAAQAACGPVVVLLTPALSLYAVPANLLAAPAVPPATVLGVGATVVAPWWPDAAKALATAASWFTAWIALVARALAGAPGAQLAWPGGTGGALALAAVTAVGIALLARAGPRRTGHVLPVAAVAVVLLVLPGPRQAVTGMLPDGWPPREWVAIQCDVGQGAAFLVRSGPAAAVMVDVGPAGAGADVCLRDAGVASVDLLVLTHGHADHVGALPEVLASVEVRRVLLGPGPEPGGAVEAVLGQLAAARVPVDRPVVGDTTVRGRAGDVAWEVLGPGADAVGVAAGDAAVNDLSLVVSLEAPGLRALALGDVELDGQARLARRLRAAPVAPYDVVVMAHHGSARQDERLAALLAPRLTLVSVGQDNDYGHPSTSAVDLYAASGPVLRTDLCGQVAVLRTDEAAGLATLAGCPAGSG
ncbi:competence protein ComEC [Georgenia soli]|uniref:Competence protein ComEC n=1 Tax=Georgenia soli TaxID=638953 RepID=A0A2A9ERT1_9MICO|nr:ComEC/Rec2 family competence protein [Georgenia soli]PFG41251.1 competence protein ComEC [Georgenia soli]